MHNVFACIHAHTHTATSKQKSFKLLHVRFEKRAAKFLISITKYYSDYPVLVSFLLVSSCQVI